MNTKLRMIFVILFASCNSTPSNETINKLSGSKSKIKNLSQKQDTIKISYDTLQINNGRYIQGSSENKFNFLLSIEGDTIVKKEDFYSKAVFLDINEDGYDDIRIYFFSNLPNECDNYLFSTKTKTFKHIENCDLDIKKIKGTDFYFSYNKLSCSDMNWESYLCKIENNVVVNYGYIYGQGCDSKLEKSKTIEIYKITPECPNKRKLIKSIPYLKHIPKFEEKWDFIERYWKQNYKEFERRG
jgi:hypothetical protein